MLSVSSKTVRTAACDQEGFYPFRSLLTGRLSSLSELADAERFARAVVLHDAIEMHAEPWPAHVDEDEWTEEEIAAGGRNVIVAVAPDLRPYGNLFADRLGPDRLDVASIVISEDLRQAAKDLSGAEPGNPYHDAHLKYLFRLSNTVREGSSFVCGGQVGRTVRDTASAYPEALFSTLDKDLQEFARECHEAHVGVRMPPVLSIVAARARNRDDVLGQLIALREEWKPGRDQLWKLIRELRTARFREMKKIRRRLEEVSKLLSPAEPIFEPSQVLWNLVPAGTPLAGAALSADPLTWIPAVIQAGSRVAETLWTPARFLFARGGIDLARQIRRNLVAAARVPEALDRLLTDQERRALTQ